jgi:hypothetical protein
VNETSEIPKLERFLKEYRSFTEERTDLRLDEFKAHFEHVRGALQIIKALGVQIERQYATQYNLFDLLGLKSDEVGAHTPFLADLLDPEGRHGQEHLFLEAFLRHCQGKEDFSDFPKPSGEVRSAQWFVSKQLPTYFGNLDLVVEAPALGQLLVIENKIYGSEQPRQLRRYADWLERLDSYPPQGKALIYLTPDGRESQTHEGAIYYRLSYRRDVVEWLESAMAGVEAARVREAVLQYIEIVRNL